MLCSHVAFGNSKTVGTIAQERVWATRPAHMFGCEGSAIAVVDVDETTGNAAAESVRPAGGDAAFFDCDITEPASVEAMMTGLVQRFGKLSLPILRSKRRR